MSIFARPNQGTNHLDDLAYDLLNFGESPIEFTDHHPDRKFGTRNQYPLKIIVPPGHMAVLPDALYMGKTLDGKENRYCVRLYGAKRPLRQVVKGVSLYDPEIYQIPNATRAEYALKNGIRVFGERSEG